MVTLFLHETFSDYVESLQVLKMCGVVAIWRAQNLLSLFAMVMT